MPQVKRRRETRCLQEKLKRVSTPCGLPHMSATTIYVVDEEKVKQQWNGQTQSQ